MKEAMLYNRLDEDRVGCHLCAHRCTIAPDKFGVCQVRQNREGKLYSLVYGQLVSQAVDPIDKKPLFHFHPGSLSFSIATVGCNFRCDFCQNAEISQMPRDHGRVLGRETPPGEVVSAAQRRGCASIAYTYTEPTIAFEYTYDVAKLANQAGIKNVYVTNGYMTAEMLEAFDPYLDAANVDLKAFSDDFYRKICGARLQPVLDSLKKMKEMGVWVEVTTLVIPGLNDAPEELGDIARFIAQELGVETPWHVSRFHPTYRMMDRPSTPVATLRQARRIGLEAGLRHVYTGNIPGDEGESTLCYGCGQPVIQRYGFRVSDKHLEGGKCAHCGAAIDGVDL